MTKNLLIFILAFLLNIYEVVGGKLEQVGSNFLKPYATNKGEATYYQFQMLPENEILSNAKIQIQFPLEFSLYNFSEELECSIAINGEFQEKDCEYYPGNIVEIEVGELKISVTHIVIGEITNPSNVGSSSNFRVTSLYNNVVIDQNQGFGTISFSDPPGAINNPSVTIISNDRISEGSTYQFRFTSSLNHYGETTIRFTFPDGFNSQSAMCDIANLIGDNPETRIYHNNRIVGCIKANKDILNTEEQIVKIVNMVNPNFSGYFQGFGIEIMDGDSSVVLEKIAYPDFAAIVQVQPGQLVAEYEASAKFKYAQVQYGFEINLINRLDQYGRLYINFTQEWNIQKEDCTIISGFEQLPGKNVTCTLIENGVDAKAYRIENFKSIGPDTQLVVQMDLESPHDLGEYDVQINTYNTIRESVIDIGNVNVMINDTYGINERWRAHPIQSPITLKAAETGPLEIIFFLKTELLKTNVGTFGKFRIEIFPAIPYPPPDPNGVLKCYFYADIPSDDCTYTVIEQPDVEGGGNVPYKTMIQMNTPLDYSFKESEIPLTITTSGAKPGQPTGITLDKMVKRYMFHIHMLTEAGVDNRNVTQTFDGADPSPHTEYYFTEFIPVPYNMDPETDVTKIDLIHFDGGEYSMFYLTIEQNFLDDFLDEHWGAKRNYKLRIRFSQQQQAWQNNLGWDNDVHYQYPCYVGGSIATSAKVLRCDLVTFNGSSPESYVDVYGFQTDEIVKGNDLEIRIPKLKLSNNAGQTLQVDIMFIEETPGMRADVVIIGQMVKNVGQVQANTPGTSSSISVSYDDSSIINDVTALTITINNIAAGSSHIIIELPTSDSDFPAMKFPYNPRGYEGKDFYHSQSNCGTNADCEYFGQDVNWIVVTATSGNTFSGTLAITTPGQLTDGSYSEYVFTMPPYEANWQYKAWTINNQLIDTYYTKNIQTDAEELTTVSFAFETTPSPIRKLTEYIFKVSFTIKNPVKADGSITLLFDGLSIQNTEHWYCKIEGDISPLTGKGIGCKEDSVAGQVILTNFDALSVGDVVTVFLALETLSANGTPNVSITTYWESNKTRRVDYKDNFNLGSGALTLALTVLEEFKVVEPAIIDEKPQAGYVGPVYIKIHMQETDDSEQEVMYIGLEKFTLPKAGQPLLCFVLEGCNTSNEEQINCESYSWDQNLKNTLPADYLGVTLAAGTVGDCFIGEGEKTLKITTEEASPNHGLIYPQYGGIYDISIEVARYYTDNNNFPGIQLKNIVEGQTHYLELMPPKLNYLDVEYITRLNGELNYFTLYGQLADDLPAYADDADPDNIDRYFKGGRFLIEFPTVDHNDNALFAADLGVAGRKTGDPVGCWFKGIPSLTNKEVDCRFIKAENSGEPAYVEVYNFDEMSADDVFELMVGPVANPTSNTKNLEIGVLTYVYDGTETPDDTPYTAAMYSMSRVLINYSKAFVYINSKPSTNKAVITDTTNYFDFEANSFVGQYNREFNYKMVYDETVAIGDYFVVQLPGQFTLQQITTTEDANLSNPSCDDSTAYDYCRNLHNIGQIVYKMKTAYGSVNSLRAGTLKVYKMPLNLPQQDLTVTTYIYKAASSQVGTVKNTIQKATLASSQSSFDSPTISYITQVKQAKTNQDFVDVEVSFTINSSIPKTGAIEIRFPTSYTKIYPNCRSMVNKGSQLYSSSHFDEGKIGFIECSVQDNGGVLSWYITGFNDLEVTIASDNTVSNKKVVKIIGQVKNPSSTQTSMVGQILSYADQHATDIFTNGQIITNAQSVAISTGVNSGDIEAQDTLPVNTDLFFLETKQLTAGQTGPIKLSVTFNANQSGNIVLRLYKTEKETGGSGGFQNLSAAQQTYLVCYFIDVASNNEKKIGALAVYSDANAATYQQFTIDADETLQSGREYHLVLDTINKATEDTARGLTYPTAAGRYRVQISTTSEQQSAYIEVVPAKFDNINFKCLNYQKQALNYIDLEISPASGTSIAQNDLVVIEIATADASGNQLFDQSELEVNSDNSFRYDIIDNHLSKTAITSMECKMFKGDSSVAEPLRIICTNFNAVINNSKALRGIFEIKNGDVSEDLYIPVSVYAQNRDTKLKSYYNFFDRVYYIKNKAAPVGIPFTPSWSSTSREQSATTDIGFTMPSGLDFREKSAWIMKYNTDLPKTTKLVAFNTNHELIYCTNMWLIIIEVGESGPITSTTLTLADHVNQNHYLDSSQLAISFQYSDFYKRETVTYDQDVTPAGLNPPSSSNPITAATIIVKDTLLLEDQNNDLLITVTTQDFEKINKVVVNLDHTKIKFRANPECAQAKNSEVTVAKCYIEKGTPHYMHIYIQQQNPGYGNSNELDLIVETRNGAFVNPDSAGITHDFIVRSFSWTGSEPVLDLSNDNYVIQKLSQTSQTLEDASSTGFTDKTAVDSVALSEFDIVYEQYIEEYPYFIDNQAYTPIEFDITTSSGTDSANTHQIDVYLPSQLQVEAETAVSDILANKLHCFIDKAIKPCSITGSKVTIPNFDAMADTEYHFKITVIDQRVYPKKEGFKWVTDNTNNLAQVIIEATFEETSTPTKYTYITELTPAYIEGGSIRTDTLSATPANNIGAALNYVQFNLALQTHLINYLLVEFDNTGYTDSAGFYSMHSLNDGDYFPCSAGNNLETFPELVCVFMRGNSNRKMGVVITGFKYNNGNKGDVNFNLIIQNPADDTVLKATISGYQTSSTGGDRGLHLVSGKKLYYKETVDVLTAEAEGYSATDNSSDAFIAPVQYPVGQLSQWTVTNVSGDTIPDNSFVLIKVPLTDASGNQICDLDSINTTTFSKNYIDVSGASFVYLGYQITGGDLADDGTFTIGQANHSEGFSCATDPTGIEIEFLKLDDGGSNLSTAKATFIASDIISSLIPCDAANCSSCPDSSTCGAVASTACVWGATPSQCHPKPNVLTNKDVSGTNNKLAGGLFVGQTSYQKVAFELDTINAVGITYTSSHILRIEFLTAASIINSDSNSCTVNTGASNSVSGTPVICEFDSSNANVIYIKNFDTLANSLVLEYHTQMQAPGSSDVKIQIYAENTPEFIEVEETQTGYDWDSDTTSDLAPFGTVDATSSQTEFVFTLNTLDQAMDTTYDATHEIFIDIIFFNQKQLTSSEATSLDIRSGGDVKTLTTPDTTDYTVTTGNGGDDETYKRIRYTITDHVNYFTNGGAWAQADPVTITLTHGLTSNNLSTYYDENYAYFQIIVTEKTSGGTLPSPDINNVVRSTTNYFIEKIIQDSPTPTSGSVQYLFTDAGAINQVQITFVPRFANLIFEFDTTHFEDHLIVHTAAQADVFEFPCILDSSPATCKRIKTTQSPAIYLDSALTVGTSYVLQIPGIEMKAIGAANPSIKVKYFLNNHVFSVFDDGTNKNWVADVTDTFNSITMSRDSSSTGTPTFSSINNDFTAVDTSMNSYEIQFQSIPSTTDPKFIVAIFSKNNEIIDFSDNSQTFCGSISSCTFVSHNGLTFMYGDHTGTITQLNFNDPTTNTIPQSPDTITYQDYEFTISAVVADNSGQVVTESVDQTLSLNDGNSRTIPDPTISRVGIYGSLYSGQTTLLQIDQQIQYTGSKVEVHMLLSDVTGTITTCSAFQKFDSPSTHLGIKCIFDTDRLKISLYDQENDNFDTSEEIHVYLFVENSTTAATQLGVKTFVYNSYTDSANNVLIAESSVVSDTADLTHVAASDLTAKFYGFKPKIFGETKNPVRINFKLDNNLTVYQIKFDNSLAITGNPVCILKTLNAKGSLTAEEKISCAMSTNTFVLTFDGAAGTAFATANRYQLVLATDDLTAYGQQITTTVAYTFQIDEWQSTDTGALELEKHGIQYEYKVPGSSLNHFEKIYFTSARKGESQNFFLEFKAPVALAQDAVTDKIYIDFVGIALSDTSFSNQDTINCQLLHSTNTFAKRKSLEPWCKALQNDDTGFFRVSIKVLTQIANEDLLSLNFEGITVPNLDDKEVSVVINWYKDTDNAGTGLGKNLDYDLYQRTIKTIYYIDGTTAITKDTVPPNPDINEDAQGFFVQANYDVDTFAWCETTVNTQVSDKLQLKFGDSDGIFEISANNNEAFYEAFSLTVNSNAVNLLFYNMKTRTIVTSAPNVSENANADLQIQNVNNPSFLEKFKYAGDDSTHPLIALTLYDDYKEGTIMNMKLPLRTEYVAGAASFTASYNTDFTWIAQEEIQLDITINLVGIDNAIRDRNKIKYVIYDFTSAGQAEITRCEYEDRSIYRTCNIENPQKIKITGIDSLDFSSGTAINLRVWGKFGQAAQNGKIGLYTQGSDSDAYVEADVTPSINNIGGLNLSTKFQPLHRKYTRDYYELLESKIYAIEGTDMVRDHLQFILTTSQTLGNTHTLKLVMSDTTHFKVDGYTTGADPEELECAIFEQIGGNKYDFGVGHVVDCEWDGSDTYTLSFVASGKSFNAGTYLVRVQFKEFIDTSSTNIIYSKLGESMKYMITITEVAASTVTDVFFVNPTHEFDLATVEHSSTTQDNFDFVTYTFTPKYTIDGYDTTDTIDVNVIVELDSNQYGNDAGYDSVFTAQNLGSFINGKYIGAQLPTGEIPMPNNADGSPQANIVFNKVTLQRGNDSDNTNFKIIYPRHVDFDTSTGYKLTIPKLKNPSSDMSLHAKISIEICDTNADYCYIHSMYEFPAHIRTLDNSSVAAWTVQINAGAELQMDNFGYYYHIQNYGGSLDTSHIMIFDRNNDDGYEGISVEEFASIELEYTSPNEDVDVLYYKILNIHVATLKDNLSQNSKYLQAKTGVKTSNYLSKYGIKRAELQKDGATLRVDVDGDEMEINAISSVNEPTFERINGFDNIGSTNWYKLVIPNIPRVPEGSFITVTVDEDSSQEDLHADNRYNIGKKCYPGKNFFQSANLGPLSCVRTGDLTYKITGFQDIKIIEPTNHITDTTVYFYLENKALQTDVQTKIDIFFPASPADLLIYSYTTSTTTTDNDEKNDIQLDVNNFTKVQFYDYFSIVYPYSEKYRPLQFLLKNAEASMGEIQITLPTEDIEGNDLDWVFNEGSPVIQYVKYKEQDTDDYILADFTFNPSTFVLTINEDSDYAFDHTKEYIILLYTSRDQSKQDSVETPTPSLYRFKVDQDNTSDVLKEQSYYDYILKPERDTDFTLTVINNKKSQETVYKIEYTLQKAFTAATDQIWLEFVTHNGLSNVFTNDLGWDVKHAMDCVEDTTNNSGFTRDKTSPQIPCFLHEGDQTTAKYTTIKMDPQNDQSAGYSFTIYVAPIKNPTANNLESTVIISHRRQCRDDGLMCALSESSDFFVTQNTGGSTTNQLLTSLNLGSVRAEDREHIYSFYNGNGNLAGGAWFLMKQPYNNHQPAHTYEPHRTCTGNDLCKVFRECSWILTRINAGIPKTQKIQNREVVTVDGLKNGYYCGTQGWVGVASQTSNGNHRLTVNFGAQQYGTQGAGNFAVNATQTSQEPGASTSSPNQFSPGYTWYVKDFNNIFEFNIKGLWTQNYIRQFRIHKPYYIDFIHTDQTNLHSSSKDGRYCNATYVKEGVPLQNYPFPPRFKCEIVGEQVHIYELKNSGIENGEGWTKNSEYSIRVYVEGYIKYDYEDYNDNYKRNQGSNWVIYSYVYPGGYDIQPGGGFRTTSTSANIKPDIAPYEQPDLNDLTFNTLSFYDRKARIGDKIEYYMLLEPKTSPLDYIIDTLVFRLPEEFQYPSILTLDQCTMIGKRPETLIPNCKLNRLDRKTYVTAIPEDGDYDDHAVKIMRLSFTKTENLFTAPMLPGDHYNISLAMYSNEILVESTGINMTDVLGVFFDISKLQADPGRDPETKSIYEFDFELGNFDIEAGYEVESTTIWSRIHLIFESKVGYDNDLGTGFAQGDEFGCVVKSGLTTEFTGRLKCEIDLGTNPEDLPTIIVTGYDRADAGTAVEILVTGIKTLPSTKRVDIKIGVELIYKYLGGISAFIYEPTAPTLPLATDAAYTATPNDGNVNPQIVTVQGDLRVLGYSDYEFTFTTAGNTVTTNDYIAFQFPEDFFEKFSNFDDVTCFQLDLADSDGDSQTDDFVECGERFIFGVSNMIYVQPEQSISANTATTIQLKGLINPAYSLQETVIITGFIQVGYVAIGDGSGDFRHGIQERTYEFILNREVLPCAKFTSAASLADSYIGGQNDVTFQVDFTTGHPVPTWGAIAITFPPQYDINLVALGVTCAAKEWDMVNAGGTPSCKAGAANRIDLFLNGYELDQLSRYSIEIFGVTTLNIDSSALEFTIASYYYNNIYLQRRVCEMQFPFPVLTPIQVKDCELLAESQYSNVKEESIYDFQFQCPEPVREDTIVQIKFPTQYKDTNVIPQTVVCKSKETQTLESQICNFKYDNSGDFILEASLQPIESQKRFTIQIQMNNPAIEKSDYQFSAQFFSKSLLYFEAEQESSQYVTIQKNQDIIIENPDIVNVKLTNIPKNAGEKSTYIFTIPPLSEQVGSTSQFSIQFPNVQENIHQPLAFDADIGVGLACGVYIQDNFDEDFFNYHSILELTQQTEGQEKNFDFDGKFIELPCSVTSTRLLTIFDINKLSEYSFEKKWFSYIIRNVNNPSSYIEGDEFTLYYLQDSNIQWSYTNELKYFAGGPPGLIKMREIAITNNNIKNPSEYQFQVYSTENLQYQPKLGISVLLPQLYSEVVTYQEDGMTCTVKLSDSVTLKASCSLYTFEILLWNIQIIDVDTPELEINIAEIINPVTETSCVNLDNSENFYIVKLIDLQSNEIIASTSPSVDDKNCLEFKKKQFNIFVSGPSVVQPGLSYEFTINLELEADGLQIEPVASVNGISFEPSVIEFSNFDIKQTTFQLKVRPDTLPGNYWLSFNSAENENDAFYLPILPFQLQVIDFNEDIQDYPTIIVQDFEVDSIGYPINVPVVLSEYLSNAVEFTVDFQNPNDPEFITIINGRQTIDTQTLQTEFQILINSETVPKSVTLLFSITSFYPTMHRVEPKSKTMKFKRNLNSITSKPSLHVLFTEDFIETNPNELGQTVLNERYEQASDDEQQQYLKVKPEIYAKESIKIEANYAEIQVLITQKCTIYYTLTYQGSTAPILQQILDSKYSFALRYGKQDSITEYERNIDHVGYLKLPELSGQSNYEIHMVAANAQGYSEIESIALKTTKLSYGVVIRIPLRTVANQDLMITALSKTLRIPKSRLILMRGQEELEKDKNDYDDMNDIMINPNYYYEVAIAPNAENDVIKPVQYAQFLTQELYTSQLDILLPAFDETREVTYRQIRQTSPKMQIEPYVSKVSCYKASISLRLWEQGKIFGIIMESELVTENPYSNQIFRGDNERNEPISSYRKFSTLSDEDGNATLEFDDLIDNTEYTVFVTVGNNLPYTPLMLYDDDLVRVFKFKTPYNLNLNYNTGTIEYVRISHPDLATALKKRYAE